MKTRQRKQKQREKGDLELRLDETPVVRFERISSPRKISTESTGAARVHLSAT